MKAELWDKIRFTGYLAGIILTGLIIPGFILSSTSRPIILDGAYLGSTFIFQAAAVVLTGVSLYVIPDVVMYISIGLSFILAEFLILDSLAHKSAYVRKWVDNIANKSQENRFLKDYGIFTLVPLMWVPGIGLYGGAAIAWLLEFNRAKAILLLFLGWTIACLAVFLVLSGILSQFR